MLLGIFCTLLVLKLAGVAALSWWVVFSPLLAAFFIAFVTVNTRSER